MKNDQTFSILGAPGGVVKQKQTGGAFAPPVYQSAANYAPWMEVATMPQAISAPSADSGYMMTSRM